jgi:hypothetical protein
MVLTSVPLAQLASLLLLDILALTAQLRLELPTALPALMMLLE